MWRNTYVSNIYKFTIGGSQALPIKAEKWTILDENDENSEEYGNDYDYNYGNDYDNDNYYGSVEVKCTNIAGKTH